jgi:hypothetical protein
MSDARAQILELQSDIENKRDDIDLLKAEMKLASRKIERILKANPELAAEFAPEEPAEEGKRGPGRPKKA